MSRTTGRWTRALWLLSLLFGGLTIWSIVIAEHDDKRLPDAAAAMLQPRADAAVSAAEVRLEMQLQSGIVNAVSMSDGSASETVARVAALYGLAARCACVRVLPAALVWVLRDDGTPLSAVSVRGTRPPSVAQLSVLRDLSKRALEAVGGFQTTVGFDARWPDTVFVAQVATHPSTGARMVVGNAVDEGELASELFAPDPLLPPSRAPHSDLRILSTDGRRLLGAAIAPTDLRAQRASSVLTGWTAVVAVPPRRVASVLMDEASLYRRWHLGLQMLLTILAVTLAARSSRAELQLLRARSEFIAGVSHDLRMPLAEVLLAAETLEIEHNAPAGRRDVLTRTVLRETRRVISMIENVLMFARAASPASPEAFARSGPVTVSALLTDCAEGASMAAEAAGQSLHVATVPEVVVQGDERLLKQALGNFVDNAIKYGPAGQTISLGAVRESGGWVHLTVDDSGPGIPRADRVRVMRPYERLARDSASVRTGSGLGLAVALQIARMAGGEVRVEDGPGGVGTRAVLRLREVAPNQSGAAP